MNTLNCPRGHGAMILRPGKKEVTFKGVDLTVDVDSYICPECGIEAGTTETSGALQNAIADEYRLKQGLLTSDEIRELRKARNLTQLQLAEIMNVGIASIKRWETGTVQSASMDHALRMQLQCRIQADNYSGNREISLERIKLVARHLEKLLGKKLLKIADKFLFLAKYLWYADFLSFRQLGRSMTGASYAAITFGPQLNNYKDLIQPIKAAESKDAEPLSEEEIRILKQIINKFPEEEMVYEAAHREKIWKETPIGALIPYSCAHELTEI